MVVDGIYYALSLAAAGALLSYLTNPWWGLPLFILAGFCLYFFRDPDRTVPQGRSPYRPRMARL